MRTKKRGFLLIEGVLQVAILALVAVGCAALFSSQFSTLSASETAVEARQVAELEAEYIKKIGYTDFNSADASGKDDNGFSKNGIHDKEIMTKFAGKTSDGGFGDRWYSKVSIVGVNGEGDGATIEKVNGEDGNNIKIAKIEVYRAKDGKPNASAEETSRYSMEVPLSSQESNSSDISDLPDAQALQLGKPYIVGSVVYDGYTYDKGSDEYEEATKTFLSGILFTEYEPYYLKTHGKTVMISNPILVRRCIYYIYTSGFDIGSQSDDDPDMYRAYSPKYDPDSYDWREAERSTAKAFYDKYGSMAYQNVSSYFIDWTGTFADVQYEGE